MDAAQSASPVYLFEKFEAGIITLNAQRQVVGMNDYARRVLPVQQMKPFERFVLDFHPERSRPKVEFLLDQASACPVAGNVPMTMIINIADPVLPQASLTVLGDSPVARALSDLAPRVGFAVQLVAQGAQAQHHPTASRVLANDDAAQIATELGTGQWVVVATQGRRDLQALKAALALKAKRTWFVASARKGAVLKESLIASGEDADRVSAIVAPAGAAIGPQTPEEIALAVLAAVVAARRAEVNDAAPAKSCCGGKKAASVPAPQAPSMPVPAAPVPQAALHGTPNSGTMLPSSSCCGS